MDARTTRRRFLAGLFAELRVVWPILSGLLALIVALAIAIGVCGVLVTAMLAALAVSALGVARRGDPER